MRTGKLRFFLLISVYSFFIAFLNGCGSGQGTATPTGTAPSAPTGVTVTAGNKQVSISWTAVSDATSYNIYWSTTSGVTKTTGTKVTSNTNSYIHPSLTNGTTYYYVVTALNSDGESSESSEVSASPISAPTGVTATAGNKQVSISWTAVSDATSYNIYWSTTSGVTKTTGTKVTSNTNSYIHPSLTNGTTYYYVVTAVDNDGESIESSEVNAMPASTNWASVSAGALHTIAIKRDDTLYTLWAWGYNASGRLGDGTTTNRTTPTQIGTATTWSSVSAGVYHTVAIKTDGTLWAWGYNELYGQLGDGTTTNKDVPTQIGAETTWSSVFSGEHHTAAIKTNGTLWAWGRNNSGQLGDGTIISKTTPTQIGAETTWSSVSGGGWHTVARKSDGTLWAWGYNDDGQLGDGTIISKTTPTQIGAETTWSSVSGGGWHTVARKSDGTLWAWGYNDDGQLGDGTIISKTTPTQIGAETTWSSVSGGGWHTVARKSDGTLWAWGYNDDGQLGDGTIISKTTPTQIGAETTWSSVSGGGWHTVARKSDGTLWAWGDNYYGQLGDGTTTDRTTPTKIP